MGQNFKKSSSLRHKKKKKSIMNSPRRPLFSEIMKMYNLSMKTKYHKLTTLMTEEYLFPPVKGSK